MTIDREAARRTIVEGEFRVLQALCQEAPAGAVWDRAGQLLAGYRFRDPLHQVVFDALCAIRAAAAADIRAALVRRLTLLGFPDVDIEPFFHRHAMSNALALSIAEYLRFSARLDQRLPLFRSP